MPNVQVFHIARVENAWQLHTTGRGNVLTFLDLGVAMDFALASAAGEGPVRIVVHEPAEAEHATASA